MPTPRHRIRAVLFDVGGTLVYEPDLSEWTERAYRLGLDVDLDRLSEAYVSVLVEVGAEPRVRNRRASVVDFWRRTLSRATGNDVPERTAARFAAVTPRRSAPVQLYADVLPCLRRLHQERRALGVISNSVSEAIVRRVLDEAGILDYFDPILSSGSEGIEKPNPEIFRRAVRRMRLGPSEAVYVGNLAVTDAEAAESAGLHGVWVDREGEGPGGRSPRISSLGRLPSYIHRLERATLTVRSGAASGKGRPA